MLYDAIDTIITHINPELTAAEAHGMATGMICTNNQAMTSAWLQEILENAKPNDTNDEAILENLFERTRNLLLNEEFSFNLFLPDEDSLLNLHLEALRQWCQGFLYGLGANSRSSDYPSDILDIIKDFTEFTKLDTGVVGENAENDFMEITEYIRAAVIYLNVELNAGDNNTIH